MDDKLPLWKPISIVVVLVLCALMLYPPQRKLKPGLDLAGGTTLVYQVDVPEKMDARTAVDQVIASLKKRVDPQGIRNLIWRRLAGNRFEIQMALASEETKKRRKAYLAELDILTEENFTQRHLNRLLQLPTEIRQTELAKLGNSDTIQIETLIALAQAYDLLAEIKAPVAALEQSLRQADLALRQLPADADAAIRKERTEHKLSLVNQMLDAGRALRDAQNAYAQAMELALRGSVQPAEFREILELPNVPGRDETISPRAKALSALKAKSVSRATQIQAVADAYAAYEEVKGPLDDPADLIALLRGSGVLEFRIAPRPDLPDAQSYRTQLSEKGPRSGSEKPYRWLMCDRDDNGNISFAETSRARAQLEENPVAYFASQRLIGQEYNGEYYILLGNTQDTSLTPSQAGWELTRAFPDRDGNGFPAVSFRLNSVGGSLMAELTGNHKGEPMAICLDGHVISTPNIQDRIHGSGIISGGSGGFGASEMNYLIRTLNAGALQARVSENPISIKTTGPQLGQDNLHSGMKASILSLVVVAVFMVLYYFFGGIITVVALMANMVIILGVMAMLRATFTLSGIAGIVLTIGMAVDANVLIFERIREEMESGEQMLVAIRRGYSKAFSTIIDANITTLITCMVLYHTATTEIKGFALVLGIGIVATLFTSLFCTRVVMEIWLRVAKPKSLPMLPTVVPALRKLLRPNIDWIQKRHSFMVVSLLLIVVGLSAVYQRGRNMLDIEFRSGTEVSFELKKGEILSLKEVRERLTTESVKIGMPELAGDKARVVTVGEARGHEASGFSVQTLIQDSSAVSRAIKEAFSDVLDQERPLAFDKMEAKQVGEAPVFVVNQARLGDNINRPVDDDVSPFIGGIAVVLDQLDPPATEKDLEARIKRMRLQPAYEKLNYREIEVIGLELAQSKGGSSKDSLYKSVVVVSRDEATNYVDDPGAFSEDVAGLATTEWHLIRDALVRDTTLGSVSSFSSQV